MNEKIKKKDAMNEKMALGQRMHLKK